MYNDDNISRSFLRMRNISDKVVEEIKHTLFCSITFFQRALSFMRQCGKIRYSQIGHSYDILVIRYMSWITQATDTLVIFISYCFSKERIVWLYSALSLVCLNVRGL